MPMVSAPPRPGRWAVLAAGLIALAAPPLAPHATAQDGGSDALGLLLQLDSGAGQAACTPLDQATAEQAVLMHTQILVASLACGEVYADYRDRDLLQLYQDFTFTHADVLRDAQNELEQVFARNGNPAEQAYDNYRTDLANQENELIERYGTTLYCEIRESRFGSLIDSQPAQFERYALDMARYEIARQGPCTGN